MKKLLCLLMLSGLSFNALGDETIKCRKGYEPQSCSNVKNALRGAFCWKGEIKEEKKNKICLTKKKKKTAKKAKKVAVKKLKS